MERIYHHKLRKISPLIQKLNFDATDYMILEKVDAIKFENFSLVPFEDWEKGTIFSAEMQFKWRRLGDEYYILLSGENIEPDELENFDEVVTENDSVILWGWHSNNMKDFPENEYIEFQMPRTLSYPIVSNFRICLNLKIQKNKENEIVGYRFISLSEEARHESV